MIDPETGKEIVLRSGAMPEDWHERNDTGYVPGGAAAMAERILSEPAQGHDGAGGDGWDMARDSTGKDEDNSSSPWRGLDSVDR